MGIGRVVAAGAGQATARRQPRLVEEPVADGGAGGRPRCRAGERVRVRAEPAGLAAAARWPGCRAPVSGAGCHRHRRPAARLNARADAVAVKGGHGRLQVVVEPRCCRGKAAAAMEALWRRTSTVVAQVGLTKTRPDAPASGPPAEPVLLLGGIAPGGARHGPADRHAAARRLQRLLARARRGAARELRAGRLASRCSAMASRACAASPRR